MAHNLFGARFIGNREPGWHKLGKVFTGPKLASEGVIEADMDYDLEKLPLYVDYSGERMESGRFAIVRGSTFDSAPAVFGVVGPEYELLLNMELAKRLDPLTGVWPLETIGALGHGEQVFFSLDAGEDRVLGLASEAIRNYFIVTNGHGNGRACNFHYSPTRIVCQNTMELAERTATFTAQLGHHAGVAEEFSFRTEMIARLTATKSATLEVLNAMAMTRITAAQVAKIISAAFPEPRAPRKHDLVEELRASGVDVDLSRYDDATKVFESRKLAMAACRAGASELVSVVNDESPQISGTAYGALQGVIELSDWRDGGSDASAARSAFDGTRADEKRRAYAMALSFVSSN